MTNLKGKNVLITGSCQGLGESIARECHAQGARVVITGLPAEAPLGREVAKSLDTTFIAADLEKEADCRELIKQAVAALGHLDSLVNSAAYNPRANLFTTTTDLYTRIFKINLLAPFVLTQDFVKSRLSKKLTGGCVINIGSVQAHCGAPFSMAYASLKGGLVVQTKNNAKELRVHRVRVNCILPGWMPTDGEIALQRSLGAPSGWVSKADGGAPMGRLLRPHECASYVAFLLSDAACMTTGTVVELHPEMISGSLPETLGEGAKL